MPECVFVVFCPPNVLKKHFMFWILVGGDFRYLWRLLLHDSHCVCKQSVGWGELGLTSPAEKAGEGEREREREREGERERG